MKTLILVHPGSLCGSANFNLGKQEARAVRDEVIAELSAWDGNILVLDGALSDELDSYPSLQQAINDAVAKAPAFGQRIDADDPEHAQLALAYLQQRGVSEGSLVALTGAWYDPSDASDASDASGCVNATRTALAGAGFSQVSVLGSLATFSRLRHPGWRRRCWG